MEERHEQDGGGREKGQRHAEIHEGDTKELKKSRNEAGAITQTLWSVQYFQTWCAEKDVAVDFKSITKMELNQSLRQFNATVRNGKGEHFGSSCFVGLREGLNSHISDPPISRFWCLMKDPAFTKQTTFLLE